MLIIKKSQFGSIEDKLTVEIINYIKRKSKKLLQKELDDSFFDVLNPKFFIEAEALQCITKFDHYYFFLIVKVFDYEFDEKDGLGAQLKVFKHDKTPVTCFLNLESLEDEFVELFK